MKFRDVLGNAPLENGDHDNLTIALCTYFEHHMDRPENDPPGEFGWGEWVENKVEEALDLIVLEIESKLGYIEFEENHI